MFAPPIAIYTQGPTLKLYTVKPALKATCK